MVDTRRKPFAELTSKQKLLYVIIPTAAALWSIFGGMYSFSQAVLAYSTLSSTAADIFSMAANFDSAPIIDATLSDVPCADLATSSKLSWQGLIASDRFKSNGPLIERSNERDTSFTGKWHGAEAYCMCGTTDFPAKTATEKEAKKHKCTVTTYDVSKDDRLLGCLKSGGTTTAGTAGAAGTVNTKNDGTIYSGLGLCNDTAIAQGCVSIPKVEPIDLVKFPAAWGGASAQATAPSSASRAGKYFCVRRASKAWKDYSITNKAADCDAANEVFCGTFCFEKKEMDGKCPAKSLSFTNKASAGSGVIVNRMSSSVTTANGLNSTATPIVNIVLGRGLPCYGYEGGDGMGYPKQIFTGIPNLKEADNGWKNVGQCGYKNTRTPKESKATGVDMRYTVSVKFDQWSLYAANGIAANGVETKLGVVGTAAARTMYNPYLAADAGTTANDKSNVGVASMWTLATRGGLYWKPECASEATKKRGDVSKNKDPITQLVNLHYWLMFTQGFFGLFIVGIVLGITTLYSMHSPNQDCPCVSGEGAVEIQRIGKFKTSCGTISNIIKVPVLLFCVSVTGTAGSTFAKFNGCAGDDISNRSFKSISDMIMAADAADTRALYIDLATLLYTVIVSVMAWKKGCKPNYAIMRDPPEGWDDDARKDVEIGDS